MSNDLSLVLEFERFRHEKESCPWTVIYEK